jgi:lambda repressor-like predicted transcriptional regulator
VTKVRTPKELPGEVQQAIVDGYRSGTSMKELARVFGVHRTTIRAALDRHGEPVRVRTISPVQVEAASQLYRSGLSLAAVGGKLGFDAATIATHLRRAGVPIRDPHGRIQ